MRADSRVLSSRAARPAPAVELVNRGTVAFTTDGPVKVSHGLVGSDLSSLEGSKMQPWSANEP